jgi:formate dehydrogenase major subunit
MHNGVAMPMHITLNGQATLAQSGDTLLQVAQHAGIRIPTLCHSNGLAPAGNCRACVVEVKGERTLAASCCRVVTPGMEVLTCCRQPAHGG